LPSLPQRAAGAPPLARLSPLYTTSYHIFDHIFRRESRGPENRFAISVHPPPGVRPRRRRRDRGDSASWTNSPAGIRWVSRRGAQY